MPLTAPLPLHVAERLARQAVAHGTPIGPRAVAALLAMLDDPARPAAVRKGASAELVVLNAQLRTALAEAEQEYATVDDARAELACRVDELAEELRRAKAALDAADARDLDRARQAMLDHDADGGS